MRNASDSVIAVARRFDFVRETMGANHGLWVGLFQWFTGNVAGDSWCASFASFVMFIAFEQHMPFRKSAVAHDLYTQCKQRGLFVTQPRAGDLFFYVTAEGHAHHVGFVTGPKPDGTSGYNGIAGNTSSDGASSNGDGVYEHGIANGAVFARLPATATT